ncbi:MAG: hypothetical protein AUI14_25635, partial [Actinobacteria bacterium 13_2_20CM_2_71_6]
MRQILRLVGNRYGAALSIVLLIALVVAFGRLLGHTPSAPADLGAGAVPSVDATASGSSSPAPDDGLDVGTEPSATPSLSPGAAPPQAVAVDFAKAWLHHIGVTAKDWHAALAKYATKTLADRLDGVDPSRVPADRITGNASIVHEQPLYREVAIPLDAGTLT